MRTDAAPSGSAAASLAEQCEEAAALVESVFAASPSGYKLDQALATYDDSVTYGELHTADLAVIAAAVVHSRGCTDVSSLAFCDAGSGVGKLAIAAGFVFATSLGVELAPERAAVADAGLAALAGCSTQAEGASGGVLAEEASDGVSARSGSGAAGGQRVRGRPCAARLVRGSFLDERLDSTDVLFVHNVARPCCSRPCARPLLRLIPSPHRAGSAC